VDVRQQFPTFSFIFLAFSDQGHVQTVSNFSAGAAKSAITHWMAKQQKQLNSKNRHSVGDWCKQK